MPVWTWGSDIYGRLGHGTEDYNLVSPTEVQALSIVPLKAVTCGSAHNIVVDKDGKCYTWGKCHYGQLGHGEMDTNERVPRLVEALSGVKLSCITAGDSHVLGITTEGRVYSWGIGFYGCLGHGDESSLAIPKLVEGLTGHVVTSAAAGASHSLAVAATGHVYVWGRDHMGQLGFMASLLDIPGMKPKYVHLNRKTPVEKTLPDGALCKKVAACANHSLILLQDGRVVSYGCNENGELGRPKPADGQEDMDPFVSGIKQAVVTISAGWKHCAAISKEGSLYTWGHGNYGRLGLGHCRSVPTPALVEQFPDVKSPRMTAVSCGESHTVVLDDKGHVWVFGSAHYGKLGLAGVDTGSYVSTPHLLKFTTPNGSRLSGVCCGTNHTMAFTLDNNVQQ